jgi:tricorn protease-like protein
VIDCTHMIDGTTYHLKTEENALKVRRDNSKEWETIVQTWMGQTTIFPQAKEIYVIFQHIFSLTCLALTNPADRHQYTFKQPIKFHYFSSLKGQLIIGIVSDGHLFLACNGELRKFLE